MGNKSAFSLVPMTEDWSLDQPDPVLDDSDEKRKKSISKTKKWKDFMEFAEGRLDLYRQYLPGNPALKKSEDNWIVADCVIRELEMWKNFIEGQ